MELTGSRIIKASRETVWEALNDPEVLKACIPGCTELIRDENGDFTAVATQKVGPVKATFKGAVTLTDIVTLESYTITGEGKGGAAGFAKGGARVKLADVEEGTELSYEVEARVGGKLAQIGSRLVDGFAKKMADKFFTNFQLALEGPDESGEPEAKKKGWLKRLVSKDDAEE